LNLIHHTDFKICYTIETKILTRKILTSRDKI